jgi:hypothetical protein
MHESGAVAIGQRKTLGLRPIDGIEAGASASMRKAESRRNVEIKERTRYDEVFRNPWNLSKQ